MLEISGQRELVHCSKDHRTLNNIKHPHGPRGPKTAVGHTRRSIPRIKSLRTGHGSARDIVDPEISIDESSKGARGGNSRGALWSC